MIISAFETAGGIQVNRLISDTEIDCQMVFPEDAGWAEALAAVENFSGNPATGPYTPTLEDIRRNANIPKLQLVMKVVDS